MKETVEALRGVSPAPEATIGTITEEIRLSMIATAAYFSAQKRGFAPGHELDDWLAAEKEINRTFGEEGVFWQ